MSENLDPRFIELMRALLGGELDAFLRALESNPALAIRLNPARENADLAARAFAGKAVPWESSGRYILPGSRPGASLAHFSGAFYAQEASAMLPARVLNVMPGELALDLCAAPGGKTGQMAAAMAGAGALIANEPDLKRARMLAGNIERLGIGNCAVVSEYPNRLAEKWPHKFQAILADAPCSGEGMFRREPAARAEWKPQSPEGCAQRQLEILDAAARMLMPGGRIVYSTCTYNSIEDEGVVAAFLDAHPNMERVDFCPEGLPPSKDGMLKIWPHLMEGDGQFAALMRDKSEKSEPDIQKRSASREALSLLERFETEFVQAGEGFTPEKWGDTLYAIAKNAPDMRNLRVISPGLALARELKGRIEPAHAAAMALSGLRGTELDMPEALAFCEGAPVASDGAGWLVARFRGMPLGWGKASGGTLKNHLPKGLRRKLEPARTGN